MASASSGGGFGTGPMEEAERIIMRWDSHGSGCGSGGSDGRMLFDSSGDRSEAERYLRAVDELRSHVDAAPVAWGSPRRASSAGSVSPEAAIQVAMARLEDEFRHVLSSRATEIEIESLVDIGSLSMTSLGDWDGASEIEPPSPSASESASAAAESDGSSHGGTRLRGYRSMRSIREVDLLQPDAVEDLRAIAKRMAAAGYGRECAQVYASIRKPAVDLALRRLGVEKLSIGDVQRLEWDALESKIRRWIRAARVAVRVVFASERRLCAQVFDFPAASGDLPFAETVKGAALQLFGFADAISIGKRTPEKLFKVIDLHDALADLLPDIGLVFTSSTSTSTETQASEILSRLSDAIRGILSEFENAVFRDPSKAPVPGGNLHPLTRYVMNYINLIADYKQTLSELIVSRPSMSSRLSTDDPSISIPELDLPDMENQSPIAVHLLWIVALLEHNLESKAALYKDAALSQIFLMNNFHYIVQKIRDSPVRALIGDEYPRRLTGLFRQAATMYQRTTWLKILQCLREEGLHVNSGFSSGISKPTLRERFKAFNASFEEAHRVQASWCVPDNQLREELRISISEKLLPAYRAFLGRFRHHIENERHADMYIKYSAEDLENALSDFFEGGQQPSTHARRRSHG